MQHSNIHTVEQLQSHIIEVIKPQLLADEDFAKFVLANYQSKVMQHIHSKFNQYAANAYRDFIDWVLNAGGDSTPATEIIKVLGSEFDSVLTRKAIDEIYPLLLTKRNC